MANIRLFRPTDLGDLRDVCIRTGDSGAEATARYADPSILPAIFAEPYAVLEPDLTFVVDNGTRVVGYVLGTADTASFVKRFRAEWLPTVAARYPASPDPVTPDQRMACLLHDPEYMLHPEFADYPAHLHIDLLPEAQGAGNGRALMETFWSALRERGVPGVHLAMSTNNTRARAFYDRLGFHELPFDPENTACLGYRLS